MKQHQTLVITVIVLLVILACYYLGPRPSHVRSFVLQYGLNSTQCKQCKCECSKSESSHEINEVLQRSESGITETQSGGKYKGT